jgi:hypothetical protein
VKEEINGQNNQFKRDYLPRGYIEGEPAAISSVDTFVRGKLRNSRGKMRDMVSPLTWGNDVSNWMDCLNIGEAFDQYSGNGW